MLWDSLRDTIRKTTSSEHHCQAPDAELNLQLEIQACAQSCRHASVPSLSDSRHAHCEGLRQAASSSADKQQVALASYRQL